MKSVINTQKQDYLISIVIPTRNRQEYALKTAMQVLSYNDPRIELVIQDNSSEPILMNLLEKLAYEHLVYNYSEKPLSFVDNFSTGLECSTGKYVCFIGDDDGIVPEIADIAQWASENNVQAIKPELQLVYYWPNSIENNASDDYSLGKLSMSTITSKVRKVSTEVELKKLMKEGCQRYLHLDLVKLYHGLVCRDALNKVNEITGHYFGGLSPDIYSAVALSLLIPEVYCIDYPLTVSGICQKSGSADSATGKHTGNLNSAPHFSGHLNYQWSMFVPPFYSVETIWADSAIAAISEFKRTDLLKLYSVESLVVNSILKYKAFKKEIKFFYFSLMTSQNTCRLFSTLVLYKSFFSVPLTDLFHRITRKMGRLKVKTKHLYGVEDIQEASKLIHKFLFEGNIRVHDVIENLNRLITHE